MSRRTHRSAARLYAPESAVVFQLLERPHLLPSGLAQGVHDITIERILADNGNRSTAPATGQTNGKVERYLRTLADEWAYVRRYATETAWRASSPGWLHTYNHYRGHTALGGNPPASRGS